MWYQGERQRRDTKSILWAFVLVSGLSPFELRVNCPCAPTPPLFTEKTISQFSCNFFRMWPLIFCQHTINKVIMPRPGEGTGNPYERLCKRLLQLFTYACTNKVNRCDEQDTIWGLYLVPGIDTFGPWVNCPYAPTTPTIYMTTISRFLCNIFPRMAHHFFGYPIHQVIWPSPGTLVPVPSSRRGNRDLLIRWPINRSNRFSNFLRLRRSHD